MAARGEAGKPIALDFMYAPPPGLARDKKREENEKQREIHGREKSDMRHDSLQEKFPQLQNAPTEGRYANNVATRHQPLGVQVSFSFCSRL